MSENKVLVVVNGKEITQQDVDMLLQSLGPQRAMMYQSPAGQKQILEEIVTQELLYADAMENKLDEEEEFKKEMEFVKGNVLKQYAITKVINQARVSDEEAAKYYEENKETFKTPETVRSSHILVDSEEKANDIMAKIDGGMEFVDAAKEFSSCPSSANGGDLGQYGRGQMVPEFDEVSFEMEIGEVKGPVKTQFGYHIIKLTEKNAEQINEFDAVKTQILQQLMAQKQTELYQGKAKELKEKYEIEYK